MVNDNVSVILVHGEDPRNIGFVARAMKCHGLSDLRLVHTLWTEMPDQAYITGVAAKDILQKARIYPSLHQALSDFDLAIAFSRRKFELASREIWLRDLPDQWPVEGKGALVFGRESQGLFQDEINLCHAVCGIPVQGTMSYNLGQAVSIALYELCGRMGEIQRKAVDPDPLSPPAQIEALLKLMSERGGELYAPQSRRLMILRNLLLRAHPKVREIKALFGLIHK